MNYMLSSMSIVFYRSIVQCTSYFYTQACNTCSYLRDIAYVYHFLKIRIFLMSVSLQRHKAAIGLNYFSSCIFLNTLLLKILFSLRNCPLKELIFFISDIVMFGIISDMVFKITSKESALMFPSLYSLLYKCKGSGKKSKRKKPK